MFFTEDPYYWGLRARIPNFVKSRSKSKSKSGAPEPPQQPLMKSKSAGSALGAGRQEESPYSLPPHPFWWHNRMYQQSNNDPGQMSESAFFSFDLLYWTWTSDSQLEVHVPLGVRAQLEGEQKIYNVTGYFQFGGTQTPKVWESLVYTMVGALFTF